MKEITGSSSRILMDCEGAVVKILFDSEGGTIGVAVMTTARVSSLSELEMSDGSVKVAETSSVPSVAAKVKVWLAIGETPAGAVAEMTTSTGALPAGRLSLKETETVSGAPAASASDNSEIALPFASLTERRAEAGSSSVTTTVAVNEEPLTAATTSKLSSSSSALSLMTATSTFASDSPAAIVNFLSVTAV